MRKVFLKQDWAAGVFLIAGILPLSAQEFATVGALAKDNNTEVGVAFKQPVRRDSLNSLDHFLVSAGEIQSLRYVDLNGAVVLTVSGLEPGGIYNLTLTNLVSPTGTVYPPATIAFTNSALSWTAIGAQELGYTADTVAVESGGFDLISGGIQMREDYDESTFVYEQVTGDFDRRVRVAFQEPTSEEARAGLMVRESLDTGSPRPSSSEEAFSRYIQIHVTPAMTAYQDGGQPVPGRNEYQAIARFYPGGQGSPTFEETLFLGSVGPAQTNTWLRIRRRGQSFSLFYGTTGTNWTQLGSYSVPVVAGLAPFANAVYVGPNFSPENGAIPFSANARRAFLASFREYSVATGTEPSEPPRLAIVKIGNEVEITWSGGGILQSSPSLLPGSWTDLQPGTSPYRTPFAQPQKLFFRVRL